jgi:hypothetical protein
VAEGGNACIPSDCSAKSAVNVTAEQCTEVCEANAQCSAAEYRPSGGWCWMRAVTNIAACKHALKSDDFELWTRPDVPLPPQPLALVYAAVVSDGGPPPLPGYER